MEILTLEDRKVGYKFYLNDKNCVLADFTKCANDENLKLSEVKYLCDNVTSLKEKDGNYYIYDYKYLSKKELEKYLDEIFIELDKDVLKGRTYLCLKHIGKYSERYQTYKKLLDEINLRNYKITGIPVEEYIIGSWNNKNEKNYVTNIMIPIETK